MKLMGDGSEAAEAEQVPCDDENISRLTREYFSSLAGSEPRLSQLHCWLEVSPERLLAVTDIARDEELLSLFSNASPSALLRLLDIPIQLPPRIITFLSRLPRQDLRFYMALLKRCPSFEDLNNLQGVIGGMILGSDAEVLARPLFERLLAAHMREREAFTHKAQAVELHQIILDILDIPKDEDRAGRNPIEDAKSVLLLTQTRVQSNHELQRDNLKMEHQVEELQRQVAELQRKLDFAEAQIKGPVPER